MKNILITGGAGFIGSHLVRLMVNKYPEYRIINLDKLTYAGNLANLKDIEKKPNYVFEKADICDFPAIQAIFEKYQVDGVIHLAAESHVDRSIKDPFSFAQTNVMGTLSMLQAVKNGWCQTMTEDCQALVMLKNGSDFGRLCGSWMWQYFKSGFYYRSKQQCISIVQCSRSDTGWQHLQKTGRSRLETLTKMSKYCMLFKYRNKILKGVMT